MTITKDKSIQTILYPLLLVFITLTACESQNAAQLTVSPNENLAAEREEQIRFDHGVGCALIDSEGILWFGSNGSGVYRINGESWTQFTHADGLSNNQVCAITEDQEGNIWFGTAEGICRYDGTSFTTITIPQSDTSSSWLDKVYPIVNPNQVMSLHQSSDGLFWIGTNGAGVYSYDGTEFTQYLSEAGKVYEDGLQHNIVLSITEDLDGNLWFTSLSHGGLNRYDGKTFTHFTTEDGLSDNFIRTSIMDKAGNIWVGTHGNRNGGLDRYDGQSFANFHKTDDGFRNNNVQWIMEDRTGLLWLGSGTTSLSTFDGNEFKEFRSSSGQTFDRVLCIVEDVDGSIWFGGAYGIWKFDGEHVIDMTLAGNR